MSRGRSHDMKVVGGCSNRLLRFSGTKGLASTFSIFCWSAASDLLTKHTDTCLAAGRQDNSENKVEIHVYRMSPVQSSNNNNNNNNNDNNDNDDVHTNNTYIKLFPAHDELGTCRTNFVSPARQLTMTKHSLRLGPHLGSATRQYC